MNEIVGSFVAGAVGGFFAALPFLAPSIVRFWRIRAEFRRMKESNRRRMHPEAFRMIYDLSRPCPWD